MSRKTKFYFQRRIISFRPAKYISGPLLNFRFVNSFAYLLRVGLKVESYNRISDIKARFEMLIMV